MSCDKQGYPSFSEAKKNRDAAVRRLKGEGKRVHLLRIYHCPDCHQFHLTKRKGKD
jgi:hypothetical protein